MAIDIDGAMTRLGNDLALFQEFIGFYEEDCPKLMANLTAAVQDRNADAVHHAAHGLKGLVASLGATDVAQQANALERMSRAGDLVDANAALEKLRREIEQLNADLAEFRKQPEATTKR